MFTGLCMHVMCIMYMMLYVVCFCFVFSFFLVLVCVALPQVLPPRLDPCPSAISKHHNVLLMIPQDISRELKQKETAQNLRLVWR